MNERYFFVPCLLAVQLTFGRCFSSRCYKKNYTLVLFFIFCFTVLGGCSPSNGIGKYEEFLKEAYLDDYITWLKEHSSVFSQLSSTENAKCFCLVNSNPIENINTPLLQCMVPLVDRKVVIVGEYFLTLDTSSQIHSLDEETYQVYFLSTSTEDTKHQSDILKMYTVDSELALKLISNEVSISDNILQNDKRAERVYVDDNSTVLQLLRTP